MQTEQLPIGRLIPYDKNAKKHPKEQVEQIAESIRQFGMNDPIAVWGEENLIVEGHGRLLACKKLGIETVPIIRLDHLTDEQRRAYTLAHNKLTMNTDFDLDLLQGELMGIKDLDMSLFGFDIDLETAEVMEDDFEPELPAEPVTKPGDIWILGQHRLMCGDCTKEQDVTALMNGQLVDLYLTDPPYNVSLGHDGSADEARKRHRRTDGLVIKNDEMPDDLFVEFLTNAFKAADGVMKEGAVFYIWHADQQGLNFRKAVDLAGWQVRQCLVWKKHAMTLGRQDYQWIHEPCLYGWKAGAAHLWASDRKQTTILEFYRPTKSKEHPTMKPVKLFDYQIQNNTKGQDIVYDGFAGSGTTIIACEQNGRVAYCMEDDPRYCDVIVKRWETLTGLKAALLGDDHHS